MSNNKFDLELGAKALGAYFRKLRQVRGLTQEEVAERAGIDRNHYQLLEAGVSNRRTNFAANPTLSTLCALASVFEVDVTELVAIFTNPNTFPEDVKADS